MLPPQSTPPYESLKCLLRADERWLCGYERSVLATLGTERSVLADERQRGARGARCSRCPRCLRCPVPGACGARPRCPVPAASGYGLLHRVSQDPTGGGPPKRAMRGPARIAYYSPQTTTLQMVFSQTTTFQMVFFQTVMSVAHSPQTPPGGVAICSYGMV